jgi:hypothetical protein
MEKETKQWPKLLLRRFKVVVVASWWHRSSGRNSFCDGTVLEERGDSGCRSGCGRSVNSCRGTEAVSEAPSAPGPSGKSINVASEAVAETLLQRAILEDASKQWPKPYFDE